MTNTQSPDPTHTDTPTLSDFKKGAAIAVTMVWVLLLLAVLTTVLTSVLTGKTPNDLGPFAALVLLIVTTPFLLFFALPTLIKNYMRRRRSPERIEHP